MGGSVGGCPYMVELSKHTDKTTSNHRFVFMDSSPNEFPGSASHPRHDAERDVYDDVSFFGKKYVELDRKRGFADFIEGVDNTAFYNLVICSPVKRIRAMRFCMASCMYRSCAMICSNFCIWASRLWCGSFGVKIHRDNS